VLKKEKLVCCRMLHRGFCQQGKKSSGFTKVNCYVLKTPDMSEGFYFIIIMSVIGPDTRNNDREISLCVSILLSLYSER
jgi:hypothetical protein